jgi:hypothetical protein
MNNEHVKSRDVTKKDIALSIIIIVLLFVPIALLMLYPAHHLVEKYLGEGRILIVWILFVLFLYLRKLVLNHIFNVED